MRTFFKKLRTLFWVSRPISWVNTAYPFAAGYIVSGGTNIPLLVVGSLFFLTAYNLLMYGVNDVFDYESDSRNPRKGGIEGMREERAQHPLILRASILLPVPFVVFLVMSGSLASSAVLIGLLFFVVAYSLKGLRFKEIPLLDSVTSSIHFVGPLMFALTLTNFSQHAWPFVIAFFLWGMASHAFGAVQDILPDREGGLSSIATVLGARTTVRLCLFLYAAAAALVIFQGGFAIAAGLAGALYVFNIVPYENVSDASSAQTNKGWRRFIWLNLIAGFVVTVSLIASQLVA